ncbi:MAG: protein translocase subunit SecD [Actinobacteria bacterium]|nr:protein translocase subunit SecD [Actinomycetota bacterium]
MTRRRLLVPLIFMVAAAVSSLLIVVITDTKPTLGLDLQGGFSVVLQAKEVNGRLPSEESVEKAKDIIRQRVDGLGVAEPDITRQGRTVIVQLPGVKNREKAESLVGCTARLEFRPVLTVAANPDAPTTTVEGQKASSTTTPASTTTTAGGSTTTAPSSSTTAGDGETGMGMVGVGTGEGAPLAAFPPPASKSSSSLSPSSTTSTTSSSTTTTVAPSTTTTAPGSTTTTTTPSSSSSTSSCGSSGVANTVTTTTVEGQPSAGEVFPSSDGQVLYTLGPVGLNGDALSSANAVLNGGDWQVNVAVKGSQKGVANELFNSCYNATADVCPPIGTDDSGAQRGAVAIVLDGEVLSAPTVNGPDLASKDFTISGSFSQSEAKDLALVLRYGSLPVEFEQAALQQVSASLGADSLRAGLIAGLVGVLALCIYMIIYYRGFGMVVVVSLFVWGALMYGLVCFLSATQGLALTLAGITGVIVSVGTTVDTYVVVFERIKDEIRNGRSVRSATERGYQSGIKTVYTANGAAFIGAFLLWYLTVGPVRGFAYFLGISVILDLLVAVAFTRPLILLLSRSPRFATGRFFGIGTATDQVAKTKAVPA